MERLPVRSLFSVTLLVLLLSGCGSSTTGGGQYAKMDAELAKQFRAMIAGNVTKVDLAGEVIPELPADFDLNPSLTLSKDALATGWPPVVIQPKLGLSVSYRKTDKFTVGVYAVAAIDAHRRTSLLLWYNRNDMNKRTGSAEQTSEDVDLVSPNQDIPVLFVVGIDGLVADEFGDDWAFAVALMGDRGAMCWSSRGADLILRNLNNYASGFRRFIIRPLRHDSWPDRPESTSLWLDPLPPQAE